MLNKLEQYLTEKNVFNYNIPEIITKLINSISTNIPYKMKQILVISEIISYISQFRINIKHWNNSSIPINAISFLIAESGASKDSTLKTIRKCFNSSYEIINAERRKRAVQQAIDKAIELGLEKPENYHTYSPFYIAPNPLFVAPSTTEGFIQHLNDIDSLGIGSGYLSTSELGAELSGNPNLVDNIKLIAELYDEGNKALKVLKDRTQQSKEIKNLPVNALFMGSQDNILYDDNIKRKFRVEFTTKLARRSFFCFVNEKIEKDNYLSIESFLEAEKNVETNALHIQEELSNKFEKLTELLLANSGSLITITDEARDLITIYKKYNELLADTIDNLQAMTKLSRQHMHWKALKLAGALALIEGRGVINVNTYSYAITFVESIFKDITLFEQELVKESYEVFVSYVNNYSKLEEDFYLSYHDLKKKKFITSKGEIHKKVSELVTMANIYDKNGIYKETSEGITFTRLQTSEQIGVSVLELTGSKEYRNSHCEKGYTYIEGKFDNLVKMLAKDITYSPFKFNNGIRSNSNIISGTKWVALDIDQSEFTDEETHQLLEDLKHIIVRTSDNTNPYKYRILLEFDNIVNIPSNNWKKFLESIAENLALNVDILPQSQIFHSYKGSNILTNFGGELFVVKPHIEYALSIDTSLNRTLSKSDLANPFETFKYAFQAKNGEGSRMMYRAAKHAKDIGASKEDIITLMYQINDYWIKPMDENRFQNTILKQVKSWEI